MSRVFGLTNLNLILRLLALSLLATIGACSEPQNSSDSQKAVVSAPPSTETTVVINPKEKVVAAVMAEMSVEDKVGQLLMPALAGFESGEIDAASRTDTPVDVAAKYGLGGVLYLPRLDEVDSAEVIRSGVADLQVVSADITGVGMLVAVDQEGGRVSRLSDQVTDFPSPQVLSGDATEVKRASYVIAQQLQRQGFNVVLAPVADVDRSQGRSFLSDRTYGDDPVVVAEMVAAAVAGSQAAGVAAAAKHWPGHGATTVDSHQVLPVIELSKDQWKGRDRLPFEAAVKRDVAIVLVGHLAVPGLDPSSLPATFSPVIIDTLLRSELGFDGVVMTDALNMGAVAGYDQGEMAVAAINAGVDILLAPQSLSETWQGILDAVKSGAVSQQRLDEATTRVLGLKYDLGLLPM